MVAPNDPDLDQTYDLLKNLLIWTKMCTLNRLTITNNTGHNKNLIKKDGLLIYRHTDTIGKETAKCNLITT